MRLDIRVKSNQGPERRILQYDADGTTGSYRNFLIQRELDVNSKCYVDYTSNPKIQ